MFDNVLWNIALGYFKSNPLNKWKKKCLLYYHFPFHCQTNLYFFINSFLLANIFLYSYRFGAGLLALIIVRVEVDLQLTMDGEKNCHVGVWLQSDTIWKKMHIVEKWGWIIELTIISCSFLFANQTNLIQLYISLLYITGLKNAYKWAFLVENMFHDYHVF